MLFYCLLPEINAFDFDFHSVATTASANWFYDIKIKWQFCMSKLAILGQICRIYFKT